MLRQDFIGRTGYMPSAQEYETIQDLYNESVLTEDEWCRNWREMYYACGFAPGMEPDIRLIAEADMADVDIYWANNFKA